jgi:tetratricopeptide (TPR) repeat protein
VLQASLAGDNGEISLRLSGSLRYFWVRRGYLSEGRTWITNALRLKSAQAPTQLRADTLVRVGDIAYMQCNYPAAREFREEALTILQQIGNQQGIARALIGLADTETAVGDYDKAESLFLQAVEITQQNGDHGGTATALAYLAWIPIRSRGDYQQAKTYLEQSLALFQQKGDRVGSALAYSGLGEVAIRQGELAEALNLLEQSLRLRQESGEKWGVAATLGSLAWVAQLQGDFEKARSHLRESVLIRRDLGDPGGIAWCLEKLAEIAHLSQDDGCAARVFAAASALRLSVNSAIDAPDVPAYERILARIRVNLGEEVYKTVWDEGLSMSLEQLFEYLGLSL